MAQRIGSWAMAGAALALLTPGASAAAPATDRLRASIDFPTVPASARRPGDEKMNCYALKAEGDRLIAESTAAAKRLKDVRVSKVKTSTADASIPAPDPKAGAPAAYPEAAMDRAMWMYALYRSKCR